MFLLFMSVLLMAIQVIFACECEEPIDWECVLIPEENTTVIMAQVEIEKPYYAIRDGFQVQELVLEKVFKNGPTNLTLIDSDRMIVMHTQIKCSFSLLVGPMYMIYGYTSSAGVLLSNKCSMEVFDDGFFNKSDRENLQNTLLGDQSDYSSG
ncbi:hypothetical protein CHS0354_032628 [Potamilus streckersoni]|uniref:Uncharacterized protein n=1 Tax=Potamilus streckersoni TaxID=2493646 RepID=A0AAE0VVT8_9BIVA|nr:hypothetical protein CHS0354_032628 [Potamilus streckersoni]